MSRLHPALFCAAALLSAGAPALAQTAPAPAAESAPAASAPAPAASTATADTTVATVNGEAITLGQMLAMKQQLQQQATAGLPSTALWDLMLDQMIRQAAVAQVGAAEMTAGDKAALEIERRNYLSSAALERQVGGDIPEAELKAAYDKAFPKDAPPQKEYRAAHILVETEDAAKAVEAELAKGADFAKVAAEKSSDTSAAGGGDLGWFTPDMMVQPFAEAVEALKKDQISAPVQSQFGWHVIKLLDSRDKTPPSFDEVKDQLAMQVRREKIEQIIQAEVAKAAVEKVPGLDPKLLDDTALLEK